MSWIKNAIVDIIVTILIITAVFFVRVVWLDWVVVGYTALILISKIAIMAIGQMQVLMKGRASDVPEWVSHTLYATNVVVLLFGGWQYSSGMWLISGGMWLLIWLFSYLTYIRITKKKAAGAKK
jgi:hypothetical protein